MGNHIVSLALSTPMVLGRWLTLDSLLDGLLEAAGVPEEKRFLPLRTVGGVSGEGASGVGTSRRSSVDATLLDEVFCASAMIAGEFLVRTRSGKATGEEEKDAAGFRSFRPTLRSRTLIGGHRPLIDFHGEENFPYATKAKIFQVSRTDTGSIMGHSTVLGTCTVSWMFQGDADKVYEIMKNIRWLGADTSSGNGWVVEGSLHIETIDEDLPDLFGIVDDTGKFLMRPVPTSVFPEFGELPVRRSIETCWAPYWKRHRGVEAFVPRTVYHDGLVTIYE